MDGSSLDITLQGSVLVSHPFRVKKIIKTNMKTQLVFLNHHFFFFHNLFHKAWRSLHPFQRHRRPQGGEATLQARWLDAAGEGAPWWRSFCWFGWDWFRGEWANIAQNIQRTLTTNLYKRYMYMYHRSKMFGMASTCVISKVRNGDQLKKGSQEEIQRSDFGPLRLIKWTGILWSLTSGSIEFHFGTVNFLMFFLLVTHQWLNEGWKARRLLFWVIEARQERLGTLLSWDEGAKQGA